MDLSHTLTTTSRPNRAEGPWSPATNPPEPYQRVQLRFADGAVRTGTWNGRIWWGYDERIHRSCALEPSAWRLAE
jgi:hypothetical protein